MTDQTFHFDVTVTCEDERQAMLALAARLDEERELGFNYHIEVEPRLGTPADGLSAELKTWRPEHRGVRLNFTVHATSFPEMVAKASYVLDQFAPASQWEVTYDGDSEFAVTGEGRVACTGFEVSVSATYIRPLVDGR